MLGQWCGLAVTGLELCHLKDVDYTPTDAGKYLIEMEFGARMLALLALSTALASGAPVAPAAASRPELRSIRLQAEPSAT